LKYITSIWSSLILVGLFLLLRISDPFLIEQLRLNTFDQYIKTLEDTKSEQIVLLDIGEGSLEKLGQYPFPRHTYAEIIRDLRMSNAGMIGFTIMFPEPDRFGGDEVFASWIKDNGILLAQDADADGRSEKAPYVGTAIFGTGEPLDWVIKYDGLVTNISQIEQEAWGVGLINAMPEIDNVTRRIPLLSQVNEELYPSFALETIRVLNDKPSYTVKVNDAGIEEIILRPFRISTDPNGSIWLNTNIEFDSYQYRVDELPDLQGKTVIVGLTAKGLGAQIPTPMGLIPAHRLQANAIQTIIDDTSISRPLYMDIMEIVVTLIGSLVIVLSVYYLPIWASLVVFFAVLSAGSAASYFFWYEWGMLLDLSFQLILYIISFTSAGFNNFYKQFVLRQQIKKQFGTYVSPELVKQLQKNPEMLVLGGERKEMTFLFMDICGFTPVSEHYKNNNDPEGLVELINRYLDRMTKIILKNGGTIDKYMGDCIMAFWNAPLDCPDHAAKAITSAREISEAADEFREELESEGLPSIDIGIGVNTGECIVGNMGSEVRFDYSVIGDAVNLASRLEGQTRNYDGVRVLLSQSTIAKSKEGLYTRVDDIQVKGKSESVTVYTF